MSGRRQDRVLPPVQIQVFGGLIVLAILVVGIVTLDRTILLAVLGFGGGCVMIGGYYEKIRHDVREAMQVSVPPTEEPPATETRASDL